MRCRQTGTGPGGHGAKGARVNTKKLPGAFRPRGVLQYRKTSRQTGYNFFSISSANQRVITCGRVIALPTTTA